MTDYSTHDKDGNKLKSIVPAANRKFQASWYENYKNDPASVEPSAEDIKCELQLQALSTVEPLKWEIDLGWFKKEIKAYEDKWVPYLRREGVVNNREGLCLVGLPGDEPWDSLSMPEAIRRAGRELCELDFNTPTQLYHDLKSLQPLLDYWNPIGRTIIVNSGAGGWFPPHKDQPLLNRECFRVAAFVSNNVTHDAYEWQMDGRIWPIKAGGVYYIDTRKTHRTHSWKPNSMHVIMNIPKTWENVMKLMSATLNY